jgi:c-di-GMP-binding flagellar brake protein YcgR
MIEKSYQRRHLRAPFKESILYADGPYVFKATGLNISEGGLLLSEIPSFPEKDEVPVMISIPQMPSLKNFSLLKIQTFSKELFGSHVVRVKARMVRREELSQNLDNIFRSRFGLEFIRISAVDQKYIEEFIGNISSNLIYLQTLIDSFNTDDETKVRVRALAKILGYQDVDKIAQLRSLVTQDYKSLQWL